MHEIQKNYIMAKASLQAYKEMLADAEKEYIEQHGIINEDGTIPKRIYCIKDMNTFNTANEEFSSIIEGTEFIKKKNSAEITLQDAEESLLSFSFSLMPGNIREILQKEAAQDAHIRKQVLDLGLCLDTSTISDL